MTDRLKPQREAEIAARVDAATRGPWSLSYEYCDCSEDCGHGLYVSRINTGAGPATELLDLPNAEWELMVHAREDIDLLRAELAAVRAERDQARGQLELHRAAHFNEAARLLEDTGHDDDAVNLLDNVAAGIRTHAPIPDTKETTTS